ELTTSVAAHPHHVWATVADFESYPNWHPFVRAVKVTTDWSTKIAARLHLTRTVPLRGSLNEHDPPNLINWDARHWVWGLLGVKYVVRFRPTPGGSDVIQTVKVTGWLPRL